MFWLPRLTAEIVERAYREGVFPMGEPETGEIYWFAPDPRAILELDEFHVPRRLARTIRQGVFDIRINTAFAEVMRGCAERPETWISDDLFFAYTDLHRRGRAHSVEAWLDGELVGGLYGVSLGGAFMGESMFSRV